MSNFNDYNLYIYLKIEKNYSFEKFSFHSQRVKSLFHGKPVLKGVDLKNYAIFVLQMYILQMILIHKSPLNRSALCSEGLNFFHTLSFFVITITLMSLIKSFCRCLKLCEWKERVILTKFLRIFI